MRQLTLGALLLVLCACTHAPRQPVPHEGTGRSPYDLPLPQGLELIGGTAAPVTVSAATGAVVYAARQSGGPSHLYLQPLDGSALRRIEGTENASAPFFSPSGEWIAFFAEGGLRRAPVEPGAAMSIMPLPGAQNGAAWAPDNTILFTPNYARGLARVPADGGEIETLTTPVRARGEVTHGWPHVLPDGEHVLFTIAYGERAPRIAVLSLATGEWHHLDGLEAGSNAQYLKSGHLVFANQARLWLLPFDPETRSVIGAPELLGDDLVRSTSGWATAHFAVDPRGTIVIVPATPPERGHIVWVERDGATAPFVEIAGSAGAPRISPDGKRVAVDVRTDPWNVNVWIFDIAGVASPLRTPARTAHIWSLDGTQLTFAGLASGTWDVYWTASDGTGPVEPLVQSADDHIAPTKWSPDGRTLGVGAFNLTTGRDMWLWDAETRTAEPLLRTPHDEYGPWFSPDGQWLAYTSNESGRLEVYVRPVGDTASTIRVSSDGGEEPLWSPTGRELFYRDGEWMMVVEVQLGETPRISPPRRLFSGVYESHFGNGMASYDVTGDGRRFLMTQNDYSPSPTRLRIVAITRP